MATPLRNVRVEDALWQAALAKTRAEGTTITEVVRAALESYGGGLAAAAAPTPRRAKAAPAHPARLSKFQVPACPPGGSLADL